MRNGIFLAVSDIGSSRSFVQGKFAGNTGMNAMLSPRPSGAQPSAMKEIPSKLQERPCSTKNGTGHNHTGASISGSAPASK